MGLATKFKPYAGYGKDEVLAPVLFVPGFAQDASSWDDVTAFFRGITRTEVFDHAKLAAADATEGETYDFAVVTAALADATRSLASETGRPPVIVGYSLGGRLVLEAIARGALLAADVSGLVLESAAAGPDDAAAREGFASRNAAWAARVAEIGAPAFMEEWAQLPLFASQRDLPQHRRDKLAEGRSHFTEVQLARQLDALGQHNQALHGDTVAALSAFLEDIPSHDVAASSPLSLAGVSPDAIGGHAAGDPASLIGNVTAVRIDRPDETAASHLLYVAGALDAKYTAEGERLVADLPTGLAELCIIPDAGHNTHFENPMAFSRILYSFLDSICI